MSIGSGLLLADWEVLTRLVQAGYGFSSATFVDTLYGRGDTRATLALQQVCDWVQSAQDALLGPRAPKINVSAFSSLSAFESHFDADHKRRGDAATCHLFLQIDASDI